MAVNYDAWLKGYNSLNDQEKQQYAQQVKWLWDDNVYNKYYKQYLAWQQQPANNPTQNNNNANSNNQSSTNSWNSTQNTQTTNSGSQQTQNLNNGYENNQNFDNSETLDTDKFWATNGQVVVKEWSAQQTWLPDYQATSDARMNEIVSNLNAYWQNNPEFFKNRQTFNQMFHYWERDQQQQALLDTYWKRKEDMDKASQYNTGDSIANWMNNAEITTDQLNYIKDYSPEAYREWQQKQQDDINLRIANMATPADPTSNAELFTSLMQQLDLEPWDPYQIYDNWYNMCDELWVFRDSQQLKSYQWQLDANHRAMEWIMNRYATSTGGTQSDALAAARMQKALAPYQQREVDLQNAYTTLLNGRNSNLAVANQSAQVLAMQAAEDQRIFNQRLSGLGFAMQTASYRTPEQQAQLQLQTQQISNDMNLLYQSQANDVNLYNQYATAKMQNQLQNDLYDLSVTDEKQLRNNLNNVLSQYYDQYWIMIQRSQQQALDDILKYAKDHNVSVSEALTQNFLTPLQAKPQYKSYLNQQTGYDPYANQQQWQYVMNEDWSVSLRVSGYGEIPESAFSSRSWRQDAYEDVYNYTWWNWVDYVQCLQDSIKDWSYGWQCGAFVNDVLKAGGADKVFGNSLKEKIDVCNADTPQVWYAAVFDFWHKSSDWINHGHVGIVTKVYDDGSIDVLESNHNGKETISTQHYSANSVKYSVQWYYRPSNYSTQATMQPRENGVSTQNGSIVTTPRGSYDKQYESYFKKWLTDTEGAKLTDADKKYVREKLWNSFDSQLYAYQMEQSSKWSQQALNVLKTIQNFENVGGRNFWGNLVQFGNSENKRIYDQLIKQLQLNELFNAKANGATFGAMSDSEWDILWKAATSLNWKSFSWFNAELENIKQALWAAAFGNNNYSKENWKAWKDANPLASQSYSSSSQSWLSTPMSTSTLFWSNGTWYNMSFISNRY